MTSARVALGVLQGLGALSFLPYPAILVANVMSMAAEGPRGMQRLIAALPYFLLSLYPLVWIALYIWSWRAISHGAAARAFTLSIIPLVLSVAGVVWFLQSSQADRDRRADEIRRKVEAENPLVYALLCSVGPERSMGATVLSEVAVLKAIAEAPDVNKEVKDYGSPLQVALMNLGCRVDGSSTEPRYAEFVKIVRALQARGARLTTSERRVVRNRFLLRMAALDGPVTTEQENALVWRIVKGELKSREPFALREDEVPLLNKPTTAHGTPLLAAFLTLDSKLAANLIQAGARLSAEESQDPAAAPALQEFFQHNRELWFVYHQRPAQ